MTGADEARAPGATPDKSSWSLASRAVHADDGIAAHRAVAPAMHVSTTFRYSDDPDKLQSWFTEDVSFTLRDGHAQEGGRRLIMY